MGIPEPMATRGAPAQQTYVVNGALLGAKASRQSGTCAAAGRFRCSRHSPLSAAKVSCSMFERIKQTVEAKKESYQATAGMLTCLALAAVFALVACVIWLAQYLGPVVATLSFAVAFLLLALGFKLVSNSREAEASKNIEAVEEQASEAVDVVSATARTVASAPTKPSVLIPTLVVAGILLVLIDRSRASPSFDH